MAKRKGKARQRINWGQRFDAGKAQDDFAPRQKLSRRGIKIPAGRVGLVGDDGTSTLVAETTGAIEQAIEELPSATRRDDDALKEAVRLAIRRSVRLARGKKPSIEVHLVRV